MTNLDKLSDAAVRALEDDDPEALATALDGAPGAQRDRAMLDAVGHGRARCFHRLIGEPGAIAVATGDGQTLLHLAARFGHVEIARELLALGLDVNGRTQSGMTPLMMASGGGRLEALRLLLQAGADRALQNRGGSTALAIARVNGRSEIVRVLAEAAGREASD